MLDMVEVMRYLVSFPWVPSHIQLPEGGNFGMGKIWNGEIWHNKIVPNLAMVFKNSCQILPAPNFAMALTKFSLRNFFAQFGEFPVRMPCQCSVVVCSPMSRVCWWQQSACYPRTYAKQQTEFPGMLWTLFYTIYAGCAGSLVGELVRHCIIE